MKKKFIIRNLLFFSVIFSFLFLISNENSNNISITKGSEKTLRALNKQKKETLKSEINEDESDEFENEHSENDNDKPAYDQPDGALQYEVKYTKDPVTKTVPKERLVRAYEYAKQLEARNDNPLSITWNERGPNNIGGRTRAILVDLNDVSRNTIFAAGVGGGLWKTTNIQAVTPTWTAIDDFFANIAITTLAQNPLNPQEIYFGTGEGWFNVDAIRGMGIWKSTNGGATFTQLASTTDITKFGTVQKISINPKNGDVYAATRGRSGFEIGPGGVSDHSGGIFRSTDGGATFVQVLGEGNGSVAYRAADVEVNANGTVYASMGIFQTDGIYKSYTGNPGSFTLLNTALSGFPATGFYRLELAMAPSDTNTFYVVAQNAAPVGAPAGFTQYGILGIYKSVNGGTLFTTCALPVDNDPLIGTDYTRGQAWYDLICAVDPNNANILWVGGIDLFQSTTGGAAWVQQTHWTGSYGHQYVHADQHQILFSPGSSTIMYFGNDGGIWRCADATALTPTIKDKNLGYNVTQYYGCAMHPGANVSEFLAGAQDNGSHKFSNSGINSVVEVSGGDGANCHIDQLDPTFQFTAYVFNSYFASTDGGNSFTQADLNSNGQFINPTDYDANTKKMYCADTPGTYLRWEDPTIAGTTNTIVTVSGMDAMVSSVTVSPNVANRVYFGTENGKLIYVNNANTGASVTGVNISTGLPNGTISCVTVQTGNENHIIITYSNYGVNSVWETTNGGTSWTSVEGNLPDMPVWWVIFSPLSNNKALLATEVGVWTTDSLLGTSTVWGPSNTGLANVKTTMLQYRTSDNLVIAATHGRGLFSTDAFSTPRVGFGVQRKVTYADINIQFSDDSYQASSWSWDFGDGGTSSAQNPVHSYSLPGTYTISLTINGNLTATKTNYITVLPKKGTPFVTTDTSWTGSFDRNPTDFANETESGTAWERGNSVIANKNGTHSGSFAWVTGLNEANYSNGSVSYLYTPEFNMLGGGTYTFKFWAKFSCETGWDGFRVESTTNGGATWTAVGTVGLTWYNYINPALATVFPAGEPYFTGPQPNYTQYSTDVSGLSGNDRVAFRFNFRTDPNTSDIGVAIDDFELDGPPNVPLPVELSNFTATVDAKKVNLNWSTVTEINNKGFYIERKLKTSNEWSTAGFVNGNGTSILAHTYSFIDNGLNSGTYSYKLKQEDFNGNFAYHNLTSDVIVGVPKKYAISQNYPNPFNPTTKIDFELPFDSRVTIKIYDMSGREVAMLLNDETKTAGYYTSLFNANVLSSGVYFYMIKAEGNGNKFVSTKKMVLLK
ncbi:MAG: T9SS type A sorting domain-containing protein [Bacteroidetes bacterium]|nr:T9SS type A sorting domain-containing protein [Bacteroidota bacterium]